MAGMGLEVDTTELEEAGRALERAGAEVQRQIPATMRTATLLLEVEAKKRAPVDTSKLQTSITSEVRGTALETVGVVGPNVEYAPPMELGTKPFWPPYKAGTALHRWAELHGVSAYLVARAISVRGLKARKYLLGAFEEKRAEVVKLFVDLVKRVRV